MSNLSLIAEKYLKKLCKLYIQDGKASIPTMDISAAQNNDSFFEELESAGYVLFKQGISPTVILQPKAIELAKTLKK